MPLSTKRHTIPMVLDSFSIPVKSIVFDGKIWIISDEIKTRNARGENESWQSRVFVFDPETEVFTEMNSTPNVFPSELHFFGADDTYLYIWRVKWDRDIRGNDYSLYKLNRASLEWKCILKVNRFYLWKSVVIINHIMYILEGTNYLIAIDLAERKIVKMEPLSIKSTNEFLTTHNATLYLISIIGRYRKVFEIKNDELIEVAQRELVECRELHIFMRTVHCADSSECVAYLHGDGHQRFEIQTFDFGSLTWESEVIRPDWLKDFHVDVKSVAKINGLIYTLVWKSEERRLELNVLDLHPKLTDICLAALTNRLSEEKDTKKLLKSKQQLPIPIKAKLEELLKWKSETQKNN